MCSNFFFVLLFNIPQIKLCTAITKRHKTDNIIFISESLIKSGRAEFASYSNKKKGKTLITNCITLKMIDSKLKELSKTQTAQTECPQICKMKRREGRFTRLSFQLCRGMKFFGVFRGKFHWVKI